MLSPRLQACAELVSDGAFLCDVGTDHAMLPIVQHEVRRIRGAIAADISEGPLRSAKRSIAKYRKEHCIHTCLSDGLVAVPREGITDIVIAGMGGETMVHILSHCPWSLLGIRLVLQPQSKAALLRQWLATNGFVIEKEHCVRDGKFLYTVLQVQYCDQSQEPSLRFCYLGKLDLRQTLAREYAQWQIKILIQMRDGRAKRNADTSELAAAIRAIQQALEEVQP